jgi:hypothetical protein
VPVHLTALTTIGRECRIGLPRQAIGIWVEQVDVKNPEVGNWVIQVRAFAVPKPPQRFSLAVTTR